MVNRNHYILACRAVTQSTLFSAQSLLNQFFSQSVRVTHLENADGISVKVFTWELNENLTPLSFGKIYQASITI